MDVVNAAYPTLLANSTLLPLLLLSLAQQKNAPETCSEFKEEEYDYIIVGAGSSGSVVASRLSEIPCARVLLLEAGKAAPLINDVPVLAANFINTEIDWKYLSVPQKHAGFGLVNRQLPWASGKGLGGSSLLNYMIYVRGHRQNYDDWARNGAVGWSYSDVLPYFLKLEDNNDPEYLADGYHAIGGPVSVHKPRYLPEMKKPLLETAELLGYKIVDSNGPTQTGFYDHQSFIRNGQRCSAAKAYLVPAENRTNLDILTNAFVKRVVIKHHRAVGVEFEHDGSTYTVRAKREVILSAGTVNTAKLLMLSGIGPKKHLKDLKIDLVEDLPVGDNFHNHLCVPVPFKVDSSIPSLVEKVQNEKNIQEYIDKRSGPLTSTNAWSLTAFGPLHTDNGVPDYELFFAEAVAKPLKIQFGMTTEAYENSYGLYENSKMYLCIASITHPKTRGTVQLNSNDPYDPPLIDPNYFADNEDLENAIKAIKACLEIGTSEPMKKIGSTHISSTLPDCGTAHNYSCVAKTLLYTFHHQVGTAKMGDPKDPTTVVDPQLRVKNIKGLRCVDGSILPTIPTGNTHIPITMVAEKASDMIKSTIKCNTQNPFISSNEFPSKPSFQNILYSP